MSRRILLLGFFIVVVASLLIIIFKLPVNKKNQSPINLAISEKTLADSIADGSNKQSPLLSEPISQARQRITKKPFGIRIFPQDSPVTPERFSGYHTGVDFEIFLGEENTEVAVFAVCDGKILLKRWVSGYGGVLIQNCVLEEADVTVLYGHLNLSSIALEVGQQILSGGKIGILGQGYTNDTDGERKHLHLGIHKGSEIDLRGYVSTVGELDNWINLVLYLAEY
ncbi:MAG: M23 family metallopeptidase [Patescibacteria group bacterium]